MEEKPVFEHIEGILKNYEETPGMKGLIDKLREVSNSYMAFVAAVATYAWKKPERLDAVMHYIDSSESPTTSDIIRFVSDQPDFHEDNVKSGNPESEDKVKNGQ